MTSKNVTWDHSAWHDVTERDMTSQHVAWRHRTWHEVTPRDMTSQNMAWRHRVWHDVTGCDILCYQVDWLITQNVDRLHQRAGSTKVTELHGTTNIVSCQRCNYVTDRVSFQVSGFLSSISQSSKWFKTWNVLSKIWSPCDCTAI